MKNHQLVIIVLLALTAVTGCKPEQPAAAPSPAAQKLDQAKAETKDAAKDFTAYAYAKKSEFVSEMREELAEVNKEIDELGDKISRDTEEAKAAAQPKLAALRVQADKLKVQLDKAEDATESTWDSVKENASKAYMDLKKSCADVRQWLSEKIAPKSN